MGSNTRFCVVHKDVRLNSNQKKYCSKQCYTESGGRRAAGKINGRIRVRNFWRRWFLEFEDRYGHLPRWEQLVVAYKRGVIHGYKGKARAKAKSRGPASTNPKRSAVDA